MAYKTLEEVGQEACALVEAEGTHSVWVNFPKLKAAVNSYLDGVKASQDAALKEAYLKDTEALHVVKTAMQKDLETTCSTERNNARPLMIGDIVRLKSGGSSMTIGWRDHARAQVYYFDSASRVVEAHMPLACLERVKNEYDTQPVHLDLRNYRTP